MKREPENVYELWFHGEGRDPKRISGILSEIEKIWSQYPDMRLGQLLVNFSGRKDLFSIEDEELLGELRCNEFPIEQKESLQEEAFFEGARLFYENVDKMQKETLMDLKFKELRKYLSVIDRLSICERETGEYHNYANIREVPDTWNQCYVYGIGRVESEFRLNVGEEFLPEVKGRELGNGVYMLGCIEIVVSKEPRNQCASGKTWDEKFYMDSRFQ